MYGFSGENHKSEELKCMAKSYIYEQHPDMVQQWYKKMLMLLPREGQMDSLGTLCKVNFLQKWATMHRKL